jgi:hypothetical protein
MHPSAVTGKRPPLSPQEGWLSDGRQVLHFRPSRYDHWSQALELTSGELIFHTPALGFIYCGNRSDGSTLNPDDEVWDSVDYMLSRIWLINVSDKDSINRKQTLSNLVSRKYYENNPMFAECSWRRGQYRGEGSITCTNKNGYTRSGNASAANVLYGNFDDLPSANGLPFEIVGLMGMGDLTKAVADCSNGVTTYMSLGHIRNPNVKGIITFTFTQFKVNDFKVTRPGPTLQDYKF